MTVPAAASATPRDVGHAQASFAIPEDACDCHVHIFDPAGFPYAAARSYTPGIASIEALGALHQRLGIGRVVLVQPSVYGTDNSCLLDALERIGARRARGVAVINADATSEGELRALREAGVRAVRINLESKGERRAEAAAAVLKSAAHRVASQDMAVQIYADLALVLEIAPDIAASPAPVILDHFAGYRLNSSEDVQPDLTALLALLETGKVWIKLSAPYRAVHAAADYGALASMVRALVSVRPDRLVWGSDWPHTGGGAERKRREVSDVEPFRRIDNVEELRLLSDWTDDAGIHDRILAANAARLFDF